MKNHSIFKTLLVICSIVSVALNHTPVFAASFTASASVQEVKPGGTFTIRIGGSCIGRVNLTATNGTVSQSAIWVEENYQSVTVTAGASGTVTVTATPEAGFSDPDANEYKPVRAVLALKSSLPSNRLQPKISLINPPRSQLNPTIITNQIRTKTIKPPTRSPQTLQPTSQMTQIPRIKKTNLSQYLLKSNIMGTTSPLLPVSKTSNYQTNFNLIPTHSMVKLLILPKKIISL